MKYACLLYDVEANEPDQSSPEFAEMVGGYMAFGEAAGEKIQGGEALAPTATATTVSVREGETITTDGPFAETKEQIGGFYILECADLDEAIAWAIQIPAAKTGRVEIRPVLEFD